MPRRGVITWYSVEGCAAGLTKSPKTWAFEGWSGSAWVVIDTQADVAGWVAGTKKAFDVVNETSYSRYRLNISALSGATACGVDGFEMAGWMMPAPTFVKNADIANDAAIAESKLDLGHPTHARIHSITDAADHSFPGGTGTFLRADGTFAVAGSAFPSGGIIMWSGAIADIPAGWYLCDGNNGTPNLTDKFVIGAGGSYAKGAAGGAATHTHAAHAVHNHAASADTGNTGLHDHGGATVAGGVDHSHTVGGNTNAASTGAGKQGTTASNMTPSSHVHGVSLTSSGASAYSHGHGINGSGNHQHTVPATANSAAAQGHDSPNHLPPYLALAYIMKG